MTTPLTPEQGAQEVPLEEQLRGIPADLRHMNYTPNPLGHDVQSWPVGTLCHRAADTLRANRERIAELERSYADLHAEHERACRDENAMTAVVERLEQQLAERTRELAEARGRAEAREKDLQRYARLLDQTGAAKEAAERERDEAQRDAESASRLLAHQWNATEHCYRLLARLRVLPPPFFAPTRGWMEFVPPDPMMYLRALQQAVLDAIDAAGAARMDAGNAAQIAPSGLSPNAARAAQKPTGDA